MGFFGFFSRFWEDLIFVLSIWVFFQLFGFARGCTGLHGVARGWPGIGPDFFLFLDFLFKIIKISIDFNDFLVIFG